MVGACLGREEALFPPAGGYLQPCLEGVSVCLSYTHRGSCARRAKFGSSFSDTRTVAPTRGALFKISAVLSKGGSKRASVRPRWWSFWMEMAVIITAISTGRAKANAPRRLAVGSVALVTASDLAVYLRIQPFLVYKSRGLPRLVFLRLAPNLKIWYNYATNK